MSRTTMAQVRNELDCCNDILIDLGVTDRKLCIDSAYGGHRLNWVFPSTGQSNVAGRGTLGEVYEQLEAIWNVLYRVREAVIPDDEWELPARYDSRASFYGKARVKRFAGVESLYSYDTLVMRFEHGELTRSECQPESATTARHMREFARQHGFNYMSKAELEQIPTF